MHLILLASSLATLPGTHHASHSGRLSLSLHVLQSSGLKSSSFCLNSSGELISEFIPLLCQCLQAVFAAGLYLRAGLRALPCAELVHTAPALPAPEALTSFRTSRSTLQPWSLTHLCTHSSSFAYVCCAQAHSEFRQALCVSKELETTGQENRWGARPVWELVLWRCHKLTDAFGESFHLSGPKFSNV